ncbi:MAG: Crp/Fnr family transcriptional regulator [Rikenellaceae bacterium]
MDNLDFNYFCGGCLESEEYRRSCCFTRYRICEYQRGDYLAVRGDRVRELGVVVEGTIVVQFVLDSGVVMRSVEHRAPYPIGAAALLSRENRYRVSIEALEDCRVIYVGKGEVESQMQGCIVFLRSFVDYATSRIDVLSAHLAVLTQRSISSKLAYYILSCSEGVEYNFGRSVTSLADHLYVERPSLSRVISEFVCAGYITHRRGRGKILDITALQQLIE